jgi:hypothetical protein
MMPRQARWDHRGNLIMGKVLKFVEKDRKWQVIPEESARLLVELTKSLSFMWSGGWAEIGADGEVALLHHQKHIGAWVCEDGGLTFSYTDDPEKHRYAASVDDALRQSLMLVMQPSGS